MTFSFIFIFFYSWFYPGYHARLDILPASCPCDTLVVACSCSDRLRIRYPLLLFRISSSGYLTTSCLLIHLRCLYSLRVRWKLIFSLLIFYYTYICCFFTIILSERRKTNPQLPSCLINFLRDKNSSSGQDFYPLRLPSCWENDSLFSFFFFIKINRSFKALKIHRITMNNYNSMNLIPRRIYVTVFF